jgi:hypothetical protein
MALPLRPVCFFKRYSPAIVLSAEVMLQVRERNPVMRYGFEFTGDIGL